MFKIPLRVDPFFWLLAFGIGWLNSQSLMGTLLWALVITISILFHELGHALTAISFGQSAQITLMAMGGVTQRQGPHLNNIKEFLIILNGPLAGFLLYFISLLIMQLSWVQSSPSLLYMATISTYINLFWTVLNLAPVQPLDGGKLLLVVFRSIFGANGIRIAFVVSLILAILIAIGFFLINAFLAGAIFLLFAFESFRGLRSSWIITASDEKQDLKNELQESIQLYESGHTEETVQRLEVLRQKAQGGVIDLTATQYLARIAAEQGDFERAYQLLISHRKQLETQDLILLQRLAYKTQRYRDTIEIGTEVHKEIADPDVGLLNSYSHAQFSEITPAIGWFRTALRDGLEHPESILKDARFDSIRHSPEFQQLLQSL